MHSKDQLSDHTIPTDNEDILIFQTKYLQDLTSYKSEMMKLLTYDFRVRVVREGVLREQIKE